jgi:hypothetical protein
VKAAAVACGVAVLFLGAALVGLGQRQVADQSPPAPIQLREATRPVTSPTPSPSSTMRTVDRYVDHRGLDYYDDHGGRRDGGNSGSGSSGSGESGSGGSGSGSGRGGGGSGSGDDGLGGGPWAVRSPVTSPLGECWPAGIGSRA